MVVTHFVHLYEDRPLRVFQIDFMSRVDGHYLVREFVYHLHPVHLVGIPGVWGDAKLR